MRIFCTRCGEKQPASISVCPICGFASGERRKIDPFERSQRQNIVEGGSDDNDFYLYDFEEKVSFPVRVYFALTNPWRKRWKRGFIWRMALVLMALALFAALGFGSYLLWSELTKVEVNNLYRTISRY